MKTTLEQLTNSLGAIKKLAGIDLGAPSLNYKFMSVISTAEAESKKHVELQKTIVEKYRDMSKTDDIYIPFENIDIFNKEMEEAGRIEVELKWDVIDCSIDALVGFSANDMKALDGIFINIKGE